MPIKQPTTVVPAEITSSEPSSPIKKPNDSASKPQQVASKKRALPPLAAQRKEPLPEHFSGPYTTSTGRVRLAARLPISINQTRHERAPVPIAMPELMGKISKFIMPQRQQQPPQQKTSVKSEQTTKSIDRRATHLASEKKRRQSIAFAFGALRSTISASALNDGDTSRLPCEEYDSKATILRKAAKTIEMLSRELRHVRGSLCSDCTSKTSKQISVPSMEEDEDLMISALSALRELSSKESTSVQ